jgi:carboxymethylenebutenolidase
MPNPLRVLTSTETIPSRGAAVQAFVARPEGMKVRPAVVVLHDWMGITAHIQDVARRFARLGCVAIVPGLFSRQGRAAAATEAEAGQLAQKLSSQDALKDLNATTRFLKTLPIIDPLKIGAVGFGLGGAFSLILAAHNSDVRAAVAFQGQVAPSDSLKYLVAPVLYVHAGKDAWVPKAEAARLQQGMAQYGRPGEVVQYPECQHGFFDETRPALYRPQEAQDAWARTLAFLAAHLRITPSDAVALPALR